MCFRIDQDETKRLKSEKGALPRYGWKGFLLRGAGGKWHLGRLYFSPPGSAVRGPGRLVANKGPANGGRCAVHGTYAYIYPQGEGLGEWDEVIEDWGYKIWVRVRLPKGGFRFAGEEDEYERRPATFDYVTIEPREWRRIKKMVGAWIKGRKSHG